MKIKDLWSFTTQYLVFPIKNGKFLGEHCFFWLFRGLYTGTMPTQLLPHAYAEWEGCLRGSFPWIGAYAGASAGFFVGWPCSLVLVGVAAFFGSEVVLGSLHVEVSVGWCGRFLGLWSGLGSLWLPSCATRKKKWAHDHLLLWKSVWAKG